MKNLEVEDSEQLHTAFLVYMDLSEGECEKRLAGAGTVCLIVRLCVSCRDMGAHLTGSRSMYIFECSQLPHIAPLNVFVKSFTHINN